MPRGPGMALAYMRRALHATHAFATLALLATGLLLEFPDLRSVAVGGYGHRILSIHLVAGAGFALLPLVALALARHGLVEDLRRRLGPPDPWRWRKSHIVGSLVAVLLLSASGAAMWADELLPGAAAETARVIHVVFTAVIGFTLGVHLVMARRKIVARALSWLGRRESHEASFDFDEG